MLRPARLALCCLLATAVMTVERAAEGQAPAADDSPQRAEAIRKYREGSKAFEEKRYKDAIDFFLEADSFVPSAALAYNTSVAYEAMGDAASALKWAREYLRRAPNAEDRAQVQTMVDRLEGRLREKGIQQVTISSAPVGATVVVDGRAVGITPWTGELRPGKHRVELRLAGFKSGNDVFELRPERSLDVSLTLTAEEQTPKVTPPPDDKKAPAPVVVDNTNADAVTITGIVALGAGVAGLGAALGLELARASAEEDVRTAEFQVDAADKLATMEDLQLGARIAVGVGGGLAVAGGALLIAGLASREWEAPAQVSAGCTDVGCAFMLRGQF
jgi:tetratricopeptide (TPR) repeat protein